MDLKTVIAFKSITLNEHKCFVSFTNYIKFKNSIMNFQNFEEIFQKNLKINKNM